MASKAGEEGVNRKGFSLIELLLVIALVALLAGLIVVDTGSLVRTFSNPPLDQQIQQALKDARDLARNSNKDVALVFNDSPARLAVAANDSRIQREWPLLSGRNGRIRLAWLTPTVPTRPVANETAEIAGQRPFLLINPEGHTAPTIVEWRDRSGTRRALLNPFTMELQQ